MEPTLTWLDFTARDRDKMRRLIDALSEKGTVDELGLGSLRDAFSNTLFPGTSTIQTRLAYALFVPWIYKRLEGKRLSPEEIRKRARKNELALVAPLLANEDHEGVIGAVAKGKLNRLPSSVYWAGLVQWGIFKRGQSRSWYHHNFSSLSRSKNEAPQSDDPGITWERKPTWHEALPDAPEEFPKALSFELRYEDARFLQDCMGAGCPGSLLKWLVDTPRADEPAQFFWDDDVVKQAPAHILEVVELARHFSLHVEGATILYNLMLAEKKAERNRDPDGPLDTEHVDRYREMLDQWATRNHAEPSFPLDKLWGFARQQGSKVKTKQHDFVENWSARLGQLQPLAVADDPELRRLIFDRETTLKPGRARLESESRLHSWKPKSGVGLGRMGFRWFRVRQLMIDLHRGLAR